MDFATLSKRIAETFPRLSLRLQRAARHVLESPDDMALMSMRGLAASAAVHPSTMVRLARARDLQARGADGDPTALLGDLLSADFEANWRQRTAKKNPRSRRRPKDGAR